jgi:hypothetical protein
VRGRFHAVAELLDGRWLTFPAPDDPVTVEPGLDLPALTRQVQREGLRLADGGTVRARRYPDTWTGPDGWLPAGQTLGLQLAGGAAHVRAVALDDAAEERGARLAELLAERSRPRGNNYFERLDTAGQGLLALLADHDDLLRDPVPPLSSLLPTPPEVLQRSS